jgi:hypothetical protein
VGALQVGCDNPTPGTPLGTFAVTTALTTNSCGGSVADTDPGNFSVTISNDNGVVFWFPDTGASSVSGALGANGAVSISEDLSGNVDGVDGGNGPCTLDRTDTLKFVLAPGSAPASFTGSYSFTVSTASGSSCNDQLTQYGGGYGTLPCTITYSLSGTRK